MTLPFIDEHTVAVDAPAATVFSAAQRYATSLAERPAGVVHRVLGTRPPSGFSLSVDGSTLELAGSHRFSRYRLVFSVSPAGALTARSYAVFPGLPGRGYRLLVISSGAHVLAVRRMLAAISARAAGSSARR